jgi:hypothetical protein
MARQIWECWASGSCRPRSRPDTTPRDILEFLDSADQLGKDIFITTAADQRSAAAPIFKAPATRTIVRVAGALKIGTASLILFY